MEFNKFFGTLKEEMIQLVKDEFGKENLQAALHDGQSFLENSKDKLEHYMKELNNKEISPEEFKSNVAGLKDLALMEALKQAGLQAAKIDKFRTKAIDLVIEVAFKAILI